MLQRISLKTLFLISAPAFFILLLSTGLMLENTIMVYATGLIPLGLGLLYLLLFYLKKFAFLIVLLIPLSVNLNDIGFGIGISLPAEIMISCLAVVFIISIFFGKTNLSQFLKHPVSVFVTLSLVWNFITVITSTMPMISIKFVLIKTLFTCVFYFFFLNIFNEKGNIKQYLNLYILSLMAVILFALYNQANSRTFNDYYYVSRPFYVDHTIYSACIAMLLPIAFVRLWWSRYFVADFLSGYFRNSIVFIILLAGTIFAYSRAAWLSLVAVFIYYFWMRLRIPFTVLLGVILFCGIIFYLVQDDALERFSRNKTVSQAGIVGHAQSMTNVSTDVSNKERINRWKCAIRMFQDKPVFGFGPGTYQFQYAPYQKPNELTRISTFNGDRGESHSEYLKPLSESGFPGFIFHVLIVFGSLFTGMRVVYRSKNKETKLLATGILLGLTTYFLHGFMNFFLDTDKAASLYWGMMAMLVAMDINIKNKIEDTAITMLQEIKKTDI